MTDFGRTLVECVGSRYAFERMLIWINAGGVINFAHEFHPRGYSEERASADMKKIHDRGKMIYKIAREEETPPCAVAVGLAQDRIRKVGTAVCSPTSG